jgi:hypothetical protein
MYKEQPYIETTVTFITPLDKDSELYQNLVFHTNTIVPVMEGLNNDVEQIIGDTFEADVSSIHCGVKNLFK